MPKTLKIRIMQCQSELSCEVKVLHADKHESLLQVDSIIFDKFGHYVIIFPRSQLLQSTTLFFKATYFMVHQLGLSLIREILIA